MHTEFKWSTHVVTSSLTGPGMFYPTWMEMWPNTQSHVIRITDSTLKAEINLSDPGPISTKTADGIINTRRMLLLLNVWESCQHNHTHCWASKIRPKEAVCILLHLMKHLRYCHLLTHAYLDRHIQFNAALLSSYSGIQRYKKLLCVVFGFSVIWQTVQIYTNIYRTTVWNSK